MLFCLEYSRPTLKCTPQTLPLAYSLSPFANHALCLYPPLVESLDNVPSLLVVSRPVMPLQPFPISTTQRKVNQQLSFMIETVVLSERKSQAPLLIVCAERRVPIRF